MACAFLRRDRDREDDLKLYVRLTTTFQTDFPPKELGQPLARRQFRAYNRKGQGRAAKPDRGQRHTSIGVIGVAEASDSSDDDDDDHAGPREQRSGHGAAAALGEPSVVTPSGPKRCHAQTDWRAKKAKPGLYCLPSRGVRVFGHGGLSSIFEDGDCSVL